MNSQRIGLLGGGQLGRMLVEAASRLNLQIKILDNPIDSPAKQIEATQQHIQGDFKDPEMIKALANSVDVLTIEIEHVNAEILETLELEKNANIQPSPSTIRLIQDKFNQKLHLTKHAIPVAEYVETPNQESVLIAGQKFGYPLMLKSRTLAYDGRGNYILRSEQDISNAVSTLSKTPLYAEKWAPFVKELAVMVVRRVNGEVRSYPVVETVHKENICHLVIAPAQIDGTVRQHAQKVAENAIKTLQGAGVFGVEMFLMEDGEQSLYP